LENDKKYEKMLQKAWRH